MGMLELLEDSRQGLRLLAKNAGSTTVAIVTLALGIGASTAVFSVVDAVLLRPLPYGQAERIVIPWRQAPAGFDLGYSEVPWGADAFALFRAESRTLQELAAFKSDAFTLTGRGEPVQLDGLRASAAFFRTLAVAPALGRSFTAEEDRPGREHEVILSDRLWRDRFGGRADVLGRTVQINGAASTVVGVMPPGFAFPRGPEMPASFAFPREALLWVPLALPAAPPRPDDPDELAVIGRLAPGVTVARAQAEMAIFAKRLEALRPKGKGAFNSRVTELPRQVAGNVRRPLLFILAAVGVVLSIACANVAGLLLTQSLGRRQELAVRAALGAGKGRLIRQLLTESLLLALGGGLAGSLTAAAAVRLIKVLGPPGIPRLGEAGLDWRVLAFGLGITLATGILSGLAPAVGAAREDLSAVLKQGEQRAGGGPRKPRLRNGLLVSQVALALVLVAAAGLLTRTFVKLLQVDAGFEPARTLTFQLSLPPVRYADADRIVRFYHDARERLLDLPGVQAAGIADVLPMGGTPEGTVIRILDHPAPDATRRPLAAYTIASPGTFAAMGTPLLRGRDFLDTDTGNSTPVAIVSRAMARKYWPGEDPIGKRLGLGSPRFPAMTVVGIVADVKHLSFREDPGPQMYVPFTQKPWPSMLTMQFVVRTAADPAAVVPGVRAALRAIDPDLPVANVATLAAIAGQAMTRPRFAMVLLGAFGALALLLAAIGMYGIVAHSVAQRRQELAIRMALGAQRRNVFALVIGQGARLGVLGIAIGLGTALAVTHTLAGFLYGVQAVDPPTLAAVSLLLLGVVLLACYLPAQRATLVDPMIPLRGPAAASRRARRVR
jgi:putative ABC transport system permease protein